MTTNSIISKPAMSRSAGYCCELNPQEITIPHRFSVDMETNTLEDQLNSMETYPYLAAIS